MVRQEVYLPYLRYWKLLVVARPYKLSETLAMPFAMAAHYHRLLCQNRATTGKRMPALAGQGADTTSIWRLELSANESAADNFVSQLSPVAGAVTEVFPWLRLARTPSLLRIALCEGRRRLLQTEMILPSPCIPLYSTLGSLCAYYARLSQCNDAIDHSPVK